MLNFSAIGGPAVSDYAPIVVTAGDRQALMADLESRLAEGQGFSLATLNLDHIVKIRHNLAFRAAYARHSHVTADGNPIVWLCRFAGQKVDLIPGSELIDPVAGLAARLAVKVAFLGSTEDSLQAASAALRALHPGLEIVAIISPPMGFDPEGPAADASIEALRASGASLCFLALGAPKQELFAARAQAGLPRVGFLSIGAGLDFLSGSQSRAPLLVRRLALEWLWRLVSNPRRLTARYAACFAILPAALRLARNGRETSGQKV